VARSSAIENPGIKRFSLLIALMNVQKHSLSSSSPLREILLSAAPCQQTAIHELEKQYCLVRSTAGSRLGLHAHPVLLSANRPGRTPQRMMKAMAGHCGIPFVEIHVTAGFSMESTMASILQRRVDFQPEGPLGMVLLSGLEQLSAQQAVQLSSALLSTERLPQVFRGNLVHLSPQQVFWVGSVAVPLPRRNPVRANGSAAVAAQDSSILTTLVDLSDAVQSKAERNEFEELMANLHIAFQSGAWLLPLMKEDFISILRSDAAPSPLHAFFQWCGRYGTLLKTDEDALEGLAVHAVKRGATLDDLDAVVRELMGPLLADIADLSQDVREVRLTAASVKEDDSPEVIRGPRFPVAEPVETGRANDTRFPCGLPMRPARTPASNQEIRLAREEDILPVLRAGNQGPVKGPFQDHALVIKGFTPLVEDVHDGSRLKALPTQDLVIPGDIYRRSALVLGLPGSGKTKRLLERGVAAALSQPEASVVVFAVQPGSRRHALAAARHYRGRKAVVAEFNPGDAGACTHRRNPIAGVTNKSKAKDAARVLSQLVMAQGQHSGDGAFFVQNALDMIAHTIMAVQSVRKDKATLEEVKSYIDRGGASLFELAKQAGSAELENFAGLLVGESRNHQTTLTQMANILDPWDDEEVCEATRAQELDFQALLLDQPGLLVISVDEEKVSKLTGLTSLIFQDLFSWIIQASRASKGGHLPRQLFLFIDELPAAGRIPDLGTRLTATFRKSNVSVMAAAQCEAQLAAVYREDTASVIAGFGTRIYVPPLEISDANLFCHKSGVIEVTQATTDHAGRVIAMAPMNRPLVLAGEINTPNHPQLGPRMLFHFAGMQPFFGYLSGSWEVPEEKKLGERALKMRLPRKHRPKVLARGRAFASSSTAATQPPQIRITDTIGWTGGQVKHAIDKVKNDYLDWKGTTGNARTWWEAFERENAGCPALIYRLLEELRNRRTTISAYFIAFVYANTDNIQAVLHYHDYTVLKRQHEKETETKSASEDLDSADDNVPF
jgi:hypothetical protein